MLSDGKFLAAAVAVSGGMALTAQIGVNASLRRFLEHPLQSTAVSFAVGTLAAAMALLVLRVPMPAVARLGASSPWMWLGGMLGAYYVFTAIVAAPKIGAALAIPLLVLGQVAVALAIDHFGWFGFPHSALSPLKLAGAALVAAGAGVIAYAQHG